MSEKTKEHWSEWFDWTMVDIYETMYHEVPGNNWSEVNIEFEHKENNYVWTITASTCKNVAYFNIERDDTDKHWAQCCVIDCSEL